MDGRFSPDELVNILDAYTLRKTYIRVYVGARIGGPKRTFFEAQLKLTDLRRLLKGYQRGNERVLFEVFLPCLTEGRAETYTGSLYIIEIHTDQNKSLLHGGPAEFPGTRGLQIMGWTAAQVEEWA